MKPSLFERLGGAEGVAAIVDDAVDRQAANPMLASRFRGHDLPQLKTLGVHLLTAGARGPQPGEPPIAQAGPAGLRCSNQELRAVVEELAAAMAEQGVGAADATEVVRLLRAAQWVPQRGTNEERGLHTLPSGGPDGGPAPSQRRSMP